MKLFPIPPRWLSTPKGQGYCDLVMIHNDHTDIQWVCTIFPSGQIWTFSNEHVRAVKNATLGLTNPEVLHETIADAFERLSRAKEE